MSLSDLNDVAIPQRRGKRDQMVRITMTTQIKIDKTLLRFIACTFPP